MNKSSNFFMPIHLASLIFYGIMTVERAPMIGTSFVWAAAENALREVSSSTLPEAKSIVVMESSKRWCKHIIFNQILMCKLAAVFSIA